ncbi:STAS domain-containing protein [Nonomuraea sediminis]|uniref:STAS domain-containing protein n=1 Tax=Nonomuraea sediminis TaxID=2835864 RepID=UPI001BDC105F|nr:STAS domain-containing protein [Nonomuraea sediminis]
MIPRQRGASSREAVLYADHQLSITYVPSPLIRLIGEIDVTNRAAVARTLIQACRSDEQLIVDVRLLEFIDTSGVCVLDNFCREGWIRLVNVQPQLHRLGSILRLTFKGADADRP